MKIWKTEQGWTRAEITSETTKQEIFDAIVVRLRDGTGQSTEGKNGRCVYRNASGNACAAGIFIPDEKYSTPLEKLELWEVMFRAGLSQKAPTTDMGPLQLIHDELENWTGTQFNHVGEARLKSLAKRLELVYREPT